MDGHIPGKRRWEEHIEPAQDDEPNGHISKRPRAQSDFGVRANGTTHLGSSLTNGSRNAQDLSDANPTNAQYSIQSPQDMQTHMSTNDFEVLKDELFDTLEKHKVGEKHKEILLPETVKATWALRCYHRLYTARSWYDTTWDKTNVMDSYLRIMSILIYMGFPTEKWDKFRDLFIDQRRNDDCLPFDLDALQSRDFLGKVDGMNFHKRQWSFCPVHIYEREEPYHLKGQELLPWVDDPVKIGEGASGIVRKQTLAAHYLIYNNKGRNFEKKAVAIKSVSNSKVHKDEFKNLRKLRGCLSGHKRIMVNIATIVEEPVKLNKTYHILYEVAAFDLNVFLTTQNSQLREKRQESAPPSRNNSTNMQPADLILESRNLADALDYLHSRLYNTKKISLAHNDIKPENILVVYPDSTDPKHKYPVGKWKLADFGLSRVKDKNTKAETKLLGPEDALARSPVTTQLTHRLEPSTSVSKTFPKRVAGRYTAPEQDQEDPQKSDGRKADVWSFGCVLAEVIAYAVQLDCTLVQEFRIYMQKPNYRDQRFYDVETKNIKACFHEYLDLLPGKVQGISTRRTTIGWVELCTKLVKKIVVKEPGKRVSADKIRDELRDVYRYMRPERQPWIDSHLNEDTAVDDEGSPSSSDVESPTEMDQSGLGLYASFDQPVRTPKIEVTEAAFGFEDGVRRLSSPTT